MAEEALAKAGLYVDDLNKIRLVPPEISDISQRLQEEAQDFSNKIKSFQSHTETVMQTMEQLARLVDSEKLKAMAAKNALKTLEKQPDGATADTQQLQILIRERQIELERLRIELEAVQREENEQKDCLQLLLAPL